jgi:hypothetical protein
VQYFSETMTMIFLGLSQIFNIVIWPFVTFLSVILNTGRMVVQLVGSAVWNFFALPVQCMTVIGGLLRAMSSEVVDAFESVWLVIQDTIQLLVVSVSQTVQSLQVVKSATPSPSIWRGLWNDILSKVFRAVNGIVKGLLAFITACNRHRLSTYNQVVEFFFRATDLLKSGGDGALTPHHSDEFWVPDSPRDGATASDEVDSEPDTPEVIHPDVASILRHRSVRHTSAAPLLLMQGQLGS